LKNNFFEFEKPIQDLEEKIEELSKVASLDRIDLSSEIDHLKAKLESLREDIFANLSPWQRVQVARHPDRPNIQDYIQHLFSNFIELHGDRAFGDDKALVAGLGWFSGERVFCLGHQKGRSTRENVVANFGMPHPEGYRKALRVAKLAEKFKRPLITFIDTPGAYPGIGAEERGQGEAIARNLFEFSMLRTPVIVVVIGEGGSGGALAIGVGDRVLILENAVYSVISPEGCAAILFKDSKKQDVAAKNLALTAPDLLKLKVIDGIIKEPPGGAHRDVEGTIRAVKKELVRQLNELQKFSIDDLVSKRYEKFRKMGVYEEKSEIRNSCTS